MRQADYLLLKKSSLLQLDFERKKIKDIYDKLVRQIEDKKENFKWDSARNKIVNIFFFKGNKPKKTSEEQGNKWIIKSKKEFLELMEELKIYVNQ